MAVVERTIIQGGGGDYTSLAAWKAATNLNGGTDTWKGITSDNSDYDEALVINEGGTSTSSRIWLTTDSANRHSGVWTTGKARMAYTGAATAVIELQSDYVAIEGMQIYRPTSGSIGDSDEGIRVGSSASTGCCISRCIIWTDDDAGFIDTDGIYIGNWEISSLYIDTCNIYGWARSASHFQQFAGDFNQSVTIDHCGSQGGGDKADEATLNIDQRGSATTTITSYNSWFAGQTGTSPAGSDVRINANGVTSTGTIAGSHNAYSSTISTGSGTRNFNDTNRQNPSDGLVDTAPSTAGVYITESDYTSTGYDATPVDHANNVLIENGTDRQGSEPDPIQDFSIDIAGNSRPTTGVDIGPFQISGGSQTINAGIATETDSALDAGFVAGGITVEVGLASSSETALPASFIPDTLIIGAGIASETDSSLSADFGAGSITVDADVSSETDTALPASFSSGQIIDADIATETDTALPAAFIAGTLTISAGISTETDTALSADFSSGLVISAGLASETDTALPASFVAGPITIDANIVNETDTALTAVYQMGTVVVPAGLASETDTALTATFSSVLVINAGIASEVETALPAAFIAGSIVLGAGIATEIDTALPILSGDPYVIPYSVTIKEGSLSVTVKDRNLLVTKGTEIVVSENRNRVTIDHARDRVTVTKQ